MIFKYSRSDWGSTLFKIIHLWPDRECVLDIRLRLVFEARLEQVHFNLFMTENHPFFATFSKYER
jgi:hypothetical protein